MKHRILAIWTIFIVATAVLTGRLFLVTLYPDKSTVRIRWQDKVRVKAAMEHMDGKITDDGRGRILFRNGQALSGQVRHASLSTANGSIPYLIHTERTVTDQFPLRQSSLAVAGEVGLPDVWPTPDRVVAEQGRSGLELTFDALLRGRRPGYIGVLRLASDKAKSAGQGNEASRKPSGSAKSAGQGNEASRKPSGSAKSAGQGNEASRKPSGSAKSAGQGNGEASSKPSGSAKSAGQGDRHASGGSSSSGGAGTSETIDGSTVFQVKPQPGPDLRTTLDVAWQDTMDSALQKESVRLGAVTILDVRSNEILAMANSSVRGGWDLPAVKPAIPGSIMKLVTAAAAFESYRFSPSTRFYCNGVSHLAGVQMRCWTVHGSETFTQAIARSCDIALAVIGSEVHRAGLEAMWQRLHLNQPDLQSVDGHPILREAQEGVLFRRSGGDNGLLANTAIGQEDVRMTPLQAANLASTIANGGIYRDVNLVLDAEMKHNPVRHFARGSESRAFSTFTAQKLTEAMSLAVTDPQGTAHDLAAFNLPIAAKTGTAELADGRVNGWMIGFLPADKPEIAFSVYVGDLPGWEAHVSVHRIADAVIMAYRQFRPPGDIG
ncbi:hypothetical protein JZ785_01320 [Alicyclobacillus curvatus]|nr:hypothetical protein JZ785_01320 [Alicyclobacillus curvatus]